MPRIMRRHIAIITTMKSRPTKGNIHPKPPHIGPQYPPHMGHLLCARIMRHITA